ncbi:decaprenylphospho-beta-D-erythro-pentofuranosid-2-ulose 2-reductase [Leekyejoonella antrihumi]|uniref:Decaprenylphospho-beta-D-erythro-pentofuranosid-2-ulose 2-reductase n=1 Tax=Leekyejoonella antrihumi TaxID=1660198 RepID=A0A563E8N8_9MICO|nr:decaprenylphospho-beta-D-erythro-pentofuranosid-2-ulose 2-reductase [Leekyejoonella antrihumi]TWP38613.1 decaprenylphospho-beta-D-erythro-pentofuranosid-2-ulose 2-reductase [Leekyejoonella antrihumi]
MKDAMQNVQRVVVIGGTSAIALATVREWMSQRPGLQVVLAARPTPARADVANELRGEGAVVSEHDLELTDPTLARAQIETVFAGGPDIDVVLVAAGVLGDQEAAWTDVDAALRMTDINYRGAVLVGVLAGRRLREQGHGAMVLLSSVAGERVRRSNFAYGASKAGADGFYLGLGEALRGDGVHVLVVRPGFVRSPMTEGLPSPPLSQDPSQVARAVIDGLAHGRRIAWSPPAMRWVMAGLRHLPYPLFRRLPV